MCKCGRMSMQANGTQGILIPKNVFFFFFFSISLILHDLVKGGRHIISTFSSLKLFLFLTVLLIITFVASLQFNFREIEFLARTTLEYIQNVQAGRLEMGGGIVRFRYEYL